MAQGSAIYLSSKMDTDMNWAFDRLQENNLSAPRSMVLLTLTKLCSETGSTDAVVEEISYISQVTRKTVYDALKYLVEIGLITREVRKPRKTIYRLCKY